jgi:hypothetical protein
MLRRPKEFSLSYPDFVKLSLAQGRELRHEGLLLRPETDNDLAGSRFDDLAIAEFSVPDSLARAVCC